MSMKLLNVISDGDDDVALYAMVKIGMVTKKSVTKK